MSPTPASHVVPTSAAIPQRTILGDETIALGSVVLVASKSKPGTWYPVIDGHCPCEGFGYRHTCRHLERARLALEEGELSSPESFPEDVRKTASSASPASPRCIRCHRRPVNPRYSSKLCTLCAGFLEAE